MERALNARVRSCFLGMQFGGDTFMLLEDFSAFFATNKCPIAAAEINK